MVDLTSRSLDINVLDTDEIYKINNAGTVEARSPVSSVRDPSVTLLTGFVAGPNAPIDPTDSVLVGLEKHEQRLDDGNVVVNINYDFLDSRFFGELGVPSNQGWDETTVGSSTITLSSETVFGETKDVVLFTATTNNEASAKINVSASDWTNILTFGASYSGVCRFQEDVGTNRIFSGVGFSAGNDPRPAAGIRSRVGIFIGEDSGTFTELNLDGRPNIILDGTGGVPLVLINEYFKWEVKVNETPDAGTSFGSAELFVNGVQIDTGAIVSSNSAVNDICSVGQSSGSGSTIFAFDNFGITIYESTKDIDLGDPELKVDITVITTPPGNRDYSYRFLSSLTGTEIGSTVQFAANHVGGLTRLFNQDPANPTALVNGQNDITFPNPATSTIDAVNSSQDGNVYDFQIPAFLPIQDRVVQSNSTQTVLIGDEAFDGTGSKLQVTGGISNDGVPVLRLENTQAVSSKADLPAPSGGVITLDTDTFYVQSPYTTVDLGTDRLESSESFSYVGDTQSVLNYDGTDAVFTQTGVGKHFEIKGMVINAATGDFVDWTAATANGVFECVDNEINCDGLGAIWDLAVGVFSFVTFNGYTTGVNMASTLGELLSVSDCIFNADSAFTGTSLDLKGSIWAILDVRDDLFVLPDVGGTGIDGVAASANIPAGALGRIASCRFQGLGTPIATITSKDERWRIQDCTNTINSSTFAALYITAANEAATAFSGTGAGNEEVVAGTWTIEDESFITCDTAGKCTFDDVFSQSINFAVQCRIEPASGTNKEYTLHFRLNGTTILPMSRCTVKADSGSPVNVTVLGNAIPVATDFVELIIQNDTDTTSVTIKSPTLLLS